MAISAIVNNISCFGGADGSIDLSMTGGNPGYYYAWSNGVVVQDQSNLPPGNYYVNVTDVLGCGLFLSTP
ncbi:MAG: hypothetical protein EBY81_02095, partial [Verrucomicrobia bacterium]|nr:hypothetical protein [Verrucomicrobiota bacterium]